MNATYRKIRTLISTNKFDELNELKITKPLHFNWVRDVFENINATDLPNQKALIWTDGVVTKEFTFTELLHNCNKLLNFLRKNSLKEQDIILLQTSILPENWISMLAGIKGGFRIVPASTILTVDDLVYRFEKLMPNVILCDSENAKKIEEAEEKSNKKIDLKIIINGERKGWISFYEIEKESTQAEAADTKSDDDLFLYFTSGTTGMPKVVVHSHLSYPFGHLTTSSWIGLKAGDIHYNISQPGWAKFAWSSFFAPWNVGATVFAFYQQARFNAKEQLFAIEKFKITTFCAPPTVLRMLIQEDLKAFTFSLRECVAAGEPLNPEVIEIWKEGTGITFRDGYGQTESTCLVSNALGKKIKYGSMGLPTFLYDVVIADDKGTILQANSEGSICVKTTTEKPNGLFKNYFEDTEKYNAVFKHGLYYTGDKAYKDDEGYIWFIGRDDDVIKASDYRIGPFEVESKLLEHKAVAESAVVGSPHAIKGYEVKAFIVLNEGYVGTKELANELFYYSRQNLTPIKMPRIIAFVKDLPKTFSGKIKRAELRSSEAEKVANKTINSEEFYYIK